MWGLTQGWVEDTLGLGQRSGPFRGSAEDGWWGAREADGGAREMGSGGLRRWGRGSGGGWGVREAGRGGGCSGGAVHETLSCRTLCAFLPGKLVESDVRPRELHRADRSAAAGRTVDGSSDIRLL